MSYHSNYLLPIERTGEYYAKKNEKEGVRVNPDEPFVKHYLKENYIQKDSRVEIRGVFYNTAILEPQSIGDHTYVVLNWKGIPIKAERNPIEIKDVAGLENYLNSVHLSLRYSDSIFPLQETNLLTDYIIPSFKNEKEGEKRLLSWESLFYESKIVLLGAPGIGKTSLLRRLALEYSDKKSYPEYPNLIPVFIQLRNLEEGENIESKIVESIQQFATELDETVLVQLKHQGQVILLLDGYDEIHEDHRDNSPCRKCHGFG